ncbi:APOBEC1 complementation factor isoform X2 [Dendroctonus ponderosae]|uniref:APOBEC1 complementation factor isoform X2 n=1 Tax=Dendroctonus ponderosae TaxID=77166 RepID=UPI0020358593|nr:APOBEC1 complementation factor isoform X2 [Dendroctonus ponderosae]
MAASREPKVFEDSNYRKKMYSPLKNDGFVPEKHSELFVTGIPQKSSIHDLLQFFEQIGEVFEIKLMTKPDGVQNRGFAYVTYMNKQLAKMALIKLKDKLFQNKTKLNLQLSVDNCRIFINGIPTNKSRYDVRNVLRYDYRIENIVDVITYRSYANPAHNRGFAFLEFRTHEEASYFRAKYWDKLYMFGKKMSVTWAIPLKEMDEHEASKVKILFLRNLNVTEPPEDFTRFIYDLIDRSLVDKVYKFKDYAYIHLSTRYNAEKLFASLQGNH